MSKIYPELFGRGGLRASAFTQPSFSYKDSAQSGFAQYAVITPPNLHVAQGISVLCKSDVYGVIVELSQLSSKAWNDTDSDK